MGAKHRAASLLAPLALVLATAAGNPSSTGTEDSGASPIADRRLPHFFESEEAAGERSLESLEMDDADKSDTLLMSHDWEDLQDIQVIEGQIQDALRKIDADEGLLHSHTPLGERGVFLLEPEPPEPPPGHGLWWFGVAYLAAGLLATLGALLTMACRVFHLHKALDDKQLGYPALFAMALCSPMLLLFAAADKGLFWGSTKDPSSSKCKAADLVEVTV